MNESSNYKKHTQSKGIRRKLINNFNKHFLQYIDEICKTHDIKTCIDVGCGEGFMLKLIQDNFPHLELAMTDIDKTALEKAKELVPIGKAVYPPPPHAKSEKPTEPNNPDKSKNSYDLVVCTEVLEHLESPEAMLADLQRICKSHIILSVPHEPYFRLGNLLTGKTTPEHIQHFSPRKFKRLCNKYFTQVKTKRVFPWILYIGKARH